MHDPSIAGSDLVRQFLNDIGRIDLLTQEEELSLAREVQVRERLLLERPLPWPDNLSEAQTQEWAERCQLGKAELRRLLREGRMAKEQMIQANLRLVVSMAKKYVHPNMELLDLVQEGTLGLERAVERFDPQRGFRFSTFAYWWIRQGILNSLAAKGRTIRLPVHVSEKIARLREAERSLIAALGRTPGITDLTLELGWDEETVRQTQKYQLRPVSLDGPVDGERDTQLGDLIEDDQAPPEEVVTRNQLREDLSALMQELTSIEAAVIRQRYGWEDDIPRTHAEIGAELNLSRERVRKIESRALRRLRQRQYGDKVRDYLFSHD